MSHGIPTIGARRQNAQAAINSAAQQLSLTIYADLAAKHIASRTENTLAADPQQLQQLARDSHSAAQAFFQGLGLLPQTDTQTPQDHRPDQHLGTVRDSMGHPNDETDTEQDGEQTPTAPTPGNTKTDRTGTPKGNDSPTAVDGAPPPDDSTRVETPAQAENRWRREGCDLEVAAFRAREREKCRAAGMSKRDAHDEAWRRAIAAYPPPGVEPVVAGPPAEPAPEPPVSDEGRVAGLGDIPSSWPPLPPNASLQAEVGWVQASRIDVVEILPGGGARVHLDRADRPAPSKAALGWLETAILFPAKFADVAVKATQHSEDEQGAVRREKLAIEEVRALLAEMLEDDDERTT